MKDELVDITKKLIGFKTISNDSDLIEMCLEYIEGYFYNSGLKVTRFQSNGVPSLLVSNSKDLTNLDLLLNGHIDVVEANEKQFRPYVRQGNIYGRGAADMKGSIACMMYFMKYYASKSSKKIGAMFVSDEEIDGENGTKYILAKTELSTKLSIVTEESKFNIVTRQKGGIVLDIYIQGRKAHGAEPWKGKNAIDYGLEIYSDLKARFKPNKALDGVSIVISNFISGIDSRCENTSGQFVPEYCQFSLDIRYLSDKDQSLIDQWLKTISKRKNIKTILKSQKEIMSSSNCKKQIQILKKIIKTKICYESYEVSTPYTSDGRFFSELKIPVIEFGPTGYNYHQDEEYIEIQSMVHYVIILEALIEKL